MGRINVDLARSLLETHSLIISPKEGGLFDLLTVLSVGNTFERTMSFL